MSIQPKVNLRTIKLTNNIIDYIRPNNDCDVYIENTYWPINSTHQEPANARGYVAKNEKASDNSLVTKLNSPKVHIRIGDTWVAGFNGTPSLIITKSGEFDLKNLDNNYTFRVRRHGGSINNTPMIDKPDGSSAIKLEFSCKNYNPDDEEYKTLFKYHQLSNMLALVTSTLILIDSCANILADADNKYKDDAHFALIKIIATSTNTECLANLYKFMKSIDNLNDTGFSAKIYDRIVASTNVWCNPKAYTLTIGATARNFDYKEQNGNQASDGSRAIVIGGDYLKSYWHRSPTTLVCTQFDQLSSYYKQKEISIKPRSIMKHAITLDATSKEIKTYTGYSFSTSMYYDPSKGDKNWASIYLPSITASYKLTNKLDAMGKPISTKISKQTRLSDKLFEELIYGIRQSAVIGEIRPIQPIAQIGGMMSGFVCNTMSFHPIPISQHTRYDDGDCEEGFADETEIIPVIQRAPAIIEDTIQLDDELGAMN